MPAWPCRPCLPWGLAVRHHRRNRAILQRSLDIIVPINTLAYVGMPPEKNNAISGIINLARNMGGSSGIAISTTLVSRRQQFHQQRLIENLTPCCAPAKNQLARKKRAHAKL